jgi:hypothetical protein
MRFAMVRLSSMWSRWTIFTAKRIEAALFERVHH